MTVTATRPEPVQRGAAVWLVIRNLTNDANPIVSVFGTRERDQRDAQQLARIKRAQVGNEKFAAEQRKLTAEARKHM